MLLLATFEEEFIKLPYVLVHKLHCLGTQLTFSNDTTYFLTMYLNWLQWIIKRKWSWVVKVGQELGNIKLLEVLVVV